MGGPTRDVPTGGPLASLMTESAKRSVSETERLGRSTISLVIPCRNEARFIGACLDSVIAVDFPKDRLEVLVVDGESDDDSPRIVEEYARRFPFIRLLHNPRRTTPAALNVGILASRGEIVARLDAHSTMAPDYLAQCLAMQIATGAENVGGRLLIRPQRATALGWAIAQVQTHWFGAGTAHHKIGGRERREVDTVFGGFYRRDAIDRIGLFNENLIRGQDMEFNRRLRRAGGTIVMDPSITSTYYSRSNLWAFARHNFVDGVWVTYALRFAPAPVSWRHLIPLAFVCSLLASLLLWAVVPRLRSLFLVVGGSYLLTSAVVSTVAAVRTGRLEYVITLPLAFTARHIPWGLGSSWGIVKLAASRGVRITRTKRVPVASS